MIAFMKLTLFSCHPFLYSIPFNLVSKDLHSSEHETNPTGPSRRVNLQNHQSKNLHKLAHTRSDK